MAVGKTREKIMKTHIPFAARPAAAILLAAVSLVLASCFYMPGVSGKAAKAGLSINRSLLPSNVSSIAVIVGGPGMETIATQYAVGTTSATLSVPSGAARTFTVLASTPSVTFRDDVTVDLQPDETTTVDLTPRLAETQIIVPDYGNFDLMQISDMSGTKPTTLSGFYPYDVDFDSQGRIYVATSGGIIQTDDIAGATLTPITTTPTDIQSIAIDRARGLLYYLGYDVQGLYALWTMDLNGKGNETKIDLSGVLGSFFSQAVAVDSDGFVYLVTTSPSIAVVKIDPNAPKLLATYSKNLVEPFDVLANGNDIYVSDYSARKIIHLSRNLDFVDDFSGPANDRFLGPERFVAILNKPITVIDETLYNEGNRLVSFGDMTGAGWTTYEPQIAGLDTFEFLYNNGGG
jgi:hypothetical protein